MARPRKQSKETTEVEIFKGSDGYWHGFLTVGTLPDGSADRRHRMGKDETVVRRKIIDLQREVAAGRTPKAGLTPKVAAFMREWVHHPDHGWRYGTQHGTYDWAIIKHIIPGLGLWRLDLLSAEAIETFLKSLRRTPEQEAEGRTLGIRPKGLSDASVHAVYRVLRSALNDAVRWRLIPRNPMDFMTWKPANPENEITPWFVDEVKQIMTVCLARRNGTRWLVGLALGPRQGECLGLPWWIPPQTLQDRPMGLDLSGGWLTVGRKAERHKWEHGCADPIACAAPHCKTAPCPARWQHGCGKDPADCTKQRVDRCPKRKPRAGCAVKNHKNPETCRKICPSGCTDHARSCPERRNGGIVFTDPKTDAGRRRIALPPQLVAHLVAHRTTQSHERAAAGELWEDNNLVWCQPNGRPIDARADWEEWKLILRLAGVRDGRIHDGRHFAATLLLLLGIDEATVMALMGWSDRRMLKRYQHVLDELRQSAARGVGDLLFGPMPSPTSEVIPEPAPSEDTDLAKLVAAAVKAELERLAATELARQAAEAQAAKDAAHAEAVEQGTVIEVDFAQKGSATDLATRDQLSMIQ